MSDCIFCKLAAGEIPSNTIYEDDDVRAILDASPAAKGHALIIPKEHFEDVFDMDEKILCASHRAAQKVASKMKDALSCDGVNILQNNGEAAGQTVFHYHVHIIPRYKGDDMGVHMKWEHVAYEDDGETEDFRKKLSL